MATKTIPQLPAAAAALTSMLFEVDNAGTSQKLTLAQIQALLLPSGTVLMWSGTIASIPAGFVFCNGANGTPDLRNRMIAGAQQDSGGVAKTNIEGSLLQVGGSNVANPVATFGAVISVTQVTNDVDVPDGNAGINVATVDLMNPYYALAFIMKT